MLTLRYIYIIIPATKEQQVLNIMSVNVCVCILALITQHANQTFSVWYYTVTCGLPDLAILFINVTFFRKSYRIQNVCFYLQFLSETFLILRIQ